MPGGCGTPSVIAVAINSPQSQKEVVGAIVIKYMINAYKNVINAKILFSFFIFFILTNIYKLKHMLIVFFKLFFNAFMFF